MCVNQRKWSQPSLSVRVVGSMLVFGIAAAGCGPSGRALADAWGQTLDPGQWHDPEVNIPLPELSEQNWEESSDSAAMPPQSAQGLQDDLPEDPLPAFPEKLGTMAFSWSSRSARPDRLIPITPEDVLWMARMVYGEANGFGRYHYTLILFTAFQRQAFLGGRPSREWSLIQFMRAFSQPINPAFNDPQTRQCQRFSRSCTPSKIARRLRVQNMTWKQVPSEIRQTVIDFVQGNIPSPAPQSIDFAASFGPEVDCRIPGQKVSFYDPPAGKLQAVFCESTDKATPVVEIIETEDRPKFLGFRIDE